MTKLDEAQAALELKLRGLKPNQTIDLAEAATDPRLAGLDEPLELLRIDGEFEVTGAAVEPVPAAVRLGGSATFSLPGQGRGVAVGVALTATEPGSGPLAFELILTVAAPSWQFGDSFANLPHTLRAPPPGLELEFGESTLAGLRIEGAAFSARNGADEQVELTGDLLPAGDLAAFEPWLEGWPLALEGTVTLPAAAAEAPELDLEATVTGAKVELEPLALEKPGFGIFAGPEPSPTGEAGPPFSELRFLGTVRVGSKTPIAARLSAPILVSGGRWRLLLEFEDEKGEPPSIAGGLAEIAGLFGIELGGLATPPALGGFETFGLDELEAWVGGSPSAGLTGIDAIGISIVSKKVWRPPIPLLTVQEVGTRWLVSFIEVEGESQTAVAGSVFGSLVFKNPEGEDPGIVDLTGTLPSFTIHGQQRAGTSIDLVAAFEQLLGYEVPAPDGKHPKLTDLDLYADPSSQVFVVSASLGVEWPLPFFVGLTITELSFEVVATQSGVSGGLGGRLQLVKPLKEGELVPTLFVRAEAPADEEAGWVFSAGLEPGAPLSLQQLFGIVGVTNLPSGLAVVMIDRLEGSIGTGGKGFWALAGALSAGWQPTLLGVQLAIAAGVELELELAEGAKSPTGWVAGRFSLNRFALALRLDVGVPQPNYSVRLQFGDAWVLATTSWAKEVGGKEVPYQVLAVQLGGVTLGDVLEEIVNLAAPTLGFTLEPPWDVLKRIELSSFVLTVDLRSENRKLALTYAVEADLGLLYLDKIGVSYTMGRSSKVELMLSGRFLDKEFGRNGKPPLAWDVVNDPPPAVPGKGNQKVELRYLGLGQRVRLESSPETVAAAIAQLREAMPPEEPGQQDPLEGSKLVFDEASEWLIGLDLRLLQTVQVALVFNDPGLYGISVSLEGKQAGSLAGLRFEILYKQLAPGLGMFRGELRIPEAFRRVELGAVSVTLGLVVVEVYTNGNFMVDLGFPHERNYQRSFTVEVFPFLGRGGIYFGVLNGMTSRRVPAIANGTFSPVLELGVGLAVGVGKSISVGPLSGGAYLELEAIFQGVLAWYHPTGSDAATDRYHWAKAMVALHGKVWGQVDFKVVKATVTLEAYAQASATFESYRATLFELEVRVRAEAEIEIFWVSISFSFNLELDLSFPVGSDEPTPWTLAPVQPPAARLLRSPRRLAGHQRAALLVSAAGEWAWPPDYRAFPSPRQISAWMLPVFSLADAAVEWDRQAEPGPAPAGAGPQWRMALPLLIDNGVSPGARTAAAVAGSVGESESSLADVVEALLRWSLNALPAGVGEPGAVTAGQLEQLAAEMEKDYVAEECFSREGLAGFFGSNFRLRILGDEGGKAPAGATAFPPPPWLQIKAEPGGESNLLEKEPKIGPHYSRGAAAYMASFSPAAGPPQANPPDDPGEYESFASHAFRDWCLMVAREAVRQARLALAEATVAMGADLASTAATLPRDQVSYVVRPGDTPASVAAWLGAGLAELEALNPKLATELGAAQPGERLPLTVGVAGCTLALDNAERKLAPGLTVAIEDVGLQVRAGETLADLAERAYGDAAEVERLLSEAELGSSTRLLRAGSSFAVGPRAGLGSDAALVAATGWVRCFADVRVPNAGWYAQTVGEAPANREALEAVAPGRPIPAGTPLTVPPSFGAAPTETYVSQLGDTLLRIGATLSLAQDPVGYDNPSWLEFYAEVTAGPQPELPETEVAVLTGESLAALAERLLLGGGAAALLPWLAGADVLDPLTVVELPSLALSSDAHGTLAELAAAVGLTVEELARRPEITTGVALFPAGEELTVKQLPARTVDEVVAEVRSGGTFAAIATQASRNLLSGIRLPAPELGEGGVASASGPLTGLAELAGWQLEAPPLDRETDLAVTVTAAGPPQEWIELPAPGGLRLAFANAELADLYPAATLQRVPVSGPRPIELTGVVPRTYGLDHRIALQAALALAIPSPAAVSPAGVASLWCFPTTLIARAKAGTTIPYEILRSAADASGVEDDDPVAASTFGTLVELRVRRLTGREGVYELIGADGADRELLRELALYTHDETGATRTAAYLGVPPVPGSQEPSGLAVLAADASATFAVRANMGSDVPLAKAPETVVASLGELSGFLQLLWEASVAESGYCLGFSTVAGQELPPGAFGDDEIATLWLLVIPRDHQAAAPEGRALLATDNCALVADGVDSAASALYVEAYTAHLHEEELVSQALVPAGSAGVTMTVPRAPGAVSDAGERLEQLLSLLVTSLEGTTYAAPRAAPPAPPQREDGAELPRWRRQRLARAARLRGEEAGGEEAVDLWRFDQLIPLSQFGPPSVAPAVPGLPDPERDPYRGFGAAAALPQASFQLGYADLLGNVSAAGSNREVEVPIGYVDPLLGPGAWPGTTASFGVLAGEGEVRLTVTIAAQPGVAAPAPSQGAGEAAAAAAKQAERYAEAYFQLAQPTVGGSLVTTLHQDSGGAPQPLPLAEGTGPLWRFAAAAYLYSAAASALVPPPPAGPIALAELAARYGIATSALAAANAGRPFSDLAQPAQPVTVAARIAVAAGDSAATLFERAGAEWPELALPQSAKDLLKLNGERELRPGAVLETAPVAIALPAEAGALTLAAIAEEHHTTPAQLAVDCAEEPILRPGFSFEAGGHRVAVGGAVRSFAAIQEAFAALAVDVACAELATAAEKREGVLADTAQLTLTHAVAVAGETLETLAAAGLRELAEQNATLPDLFPAGTMVSLGSAWTSAPTVPGDGETLEEFAGRHASTAALVLGENEALALADEPGPVLPGVAVLPDEPPPIGYAVAAGDTLAALAVVLGESAPGIAAGNAQAPGLLVAGQEVAVAVGGGSFSTTVEAGDTLAAVTARLREQNAQIDLAAVAAAIEDEAGILAPGGLLVVPAPPLAARPGTDPGPALTQAQVQAAYGLDPVAFAQANAMLPGLLMPGLALALPGGGSETTADADSANAVLGRLAARGLDVDLPELLEANPQLPLFRAGTRVLLPPRPASVSASIGAGNGPFHEPVFPLSVSLRLQRDGAVVLHPTPGEDGPVERADTPVPAPLAPPPRAEDAPAGGEPAAETIDAFVDSFEAALPGLRLGTARVEGDTADLWVVAFTAGAIESVEVAPPVAYPDGTRQPRYLALRPLYPSLQSREGVEVPEVDPETGELGEARPTSFQGIDVEEWAVAFLADLDLFVSAPYAAGIQTHGPAGALQSLLATRWKLCRAVGSGLAPVLALDDPGAAAGTEAAASEFARLAGADLLTAYNVSTVVQFDAAAVSAYGDPDRQLLPALLLGSAVRPTPDPVEPGEYSLTRAGTELAPRSSFVSFAMTVPEPAHHKEVATGPLEYAVDAVEFGIDLGAEIDGYVPSQRLSLVRPLSGAERPPQVNADLGSPLVPVPLRTHPAVPLVLGQTAAPSHRGQGQPTLKEAAEWTFGLTYSHEHAEQDEVLLAVTFNVGAAVGLGEEPGTDLAASLARYAVQAERLRDLMSWYADPPKPAPVELETVREHVAASVATLAEEIAEAWDRHWPPPELEAVAPAGPQTEVPPGDTYDFRARVEYANGGSDLEALVLTLESGEDPSPTGAWPVVSVQDAEGGFVELDGPVDSGEGQRYTPPRGIPIEGWPVVRLEWPGLNVAAVGNAQASLSARRNEELLAGLPTNAAFVLSSASITAPDVATPLLEWGGEFPLSGSGIADALGDALAELFDPSNAPPLTVSLAYSYDLVEPDPTQPESGLTSVIPCALYPNRPLSSSIAAEVESAFSGWWRKHRPAQAGAELLISLSLSSWLDPKLSRPLFLLERLAYPLEFPTADGSPGGPPQRGGRISRFRLPAR